MTNQSYRQACSIELDDKVIITGGWKSGGLGIETVAVYDENGFVEYLPDMNFNRQDHGCGHYINSNNEIVSFILVSSSGLGPGPGPSPGPRTVSKHK